MYSAMKILTGCKRYLPFSSLHFSQRFIFLYTVKKLTLNINKNIRLFNITWKKFTFIFLYLLLYFLYLYDFVYFYF